nr:protease modulator HflC [uncultured Lichenicoccus sp.]
MSLPRLIATVIAAAFAIWIVSLGLFTLTQSQQALVVRLGKPVATITDPGLHLKVPFIDTVVLYERRLLPLEPPADQIILGDQKRIEVETFSRFLIDNPLRFYQSVGTLDQARSQLAQIVSTSLRRELGQISLPILLTPRRNHVTDTIRDEVAQEAAGLGVRVVDVQIRRADLPAETSQAIYDRMMSERLREAEELRAEGFEWGQTIRAKADRDRTVLLSDAQRQSQTLRGQGDAEANRIATASYARDPEFFDLYRTLQVYRTGLTQGGATLVLSPSNYLMRYFENGPFAGQPAPDEKGSIKP